VSDTNELLKLTPPLEEMRPYIEPVREIIALVRAGAPPTGTLIDYGCGAGTWAVIAREQFAQVVGLDFVPKSIARAHELIALNQVSNVSIVNVALEPDYAFPRADAMISIDVMPVMQSDHAHQMFAFAREHLIPGGRFLVSSRRVGSMIDQVLTLERFRYDGVLGGLRRYAAVSRSALETIYAPKVRSIPRARSYHHRDAVPILAEEYGFKVESGPEVLTRLEPVRKLDWFYKGHGKTPRFFRWCNWYLLRKA
jgi:precorrin-6B methylase 2